MIKKIVIFLLLFMALLAVAGCTKDNSNPLELKDYADSSSSSLTQLTENASTVLPDRSSTDNTSLTSFIPAKSAEKTSAVSPAQSTGSISSTPQSETTTNSGEDKERDNGCKLIVNGKDITSGNYVKLNYDCRYAELPLTAVMKASGAKVEWQSKTTAKIQRQELHFGYDKRFTHGGWEQI